VAACEEEASRHHVEVIATIVEPESTGAYKHRGMKRKHWDELLALVRTGKVQVVVAYKTDRLSRGGGPGWAPLIEAAESAGLNPDRFVLIVGSGFMSEFEISIRATMDREESRKTSDRIKTSRARAAMEGRPLAGGPRAFGYELDKVTIVDEEAELIRQAARRILAGEGVNAIAREWSEAGVRTITGGEWTRSSFVQTLTSPRMAGLRQHLYEIGDDGKPDRKRPVIVRRAEWPPILDRGTWERLRAALYSPVKRERRRGSLYLLTGFLYCGKCGQKMYGNTPVNRRPGDSVRYTCLKQPGSGACGVNSILAEPTDAYVTDQVLRRFESPEFVAVLRRRRRADIDVEAKEAEIVDLEARLVQLAEEFGAGEIPRAQWLAMKAGAERRLEKAIAAVTPHRRAVIIEDLGDLTTLRNRWPVLSRDRQRAALSLVVDRITVGPVIKRGRIEGRGLDDIDWIV
jgi:DNA invertase Pin-like site-specific DNA recombinase